MSRHTMRDQIMREMHKTGCRLDDAAACADVAMRFIRSQRIETVRAYRSPPLSLREISVKTGISKSRVQQMLSTETTTVWTGASSNLPSAA